ncbi:MAG TPA: protein kinase [Pyrinomonadaceae bacterium]|nr:protein kinase [Pyrinomonadaceae bacterium]
MSETDPQRWQRVKEIFEGALERRGVERESFLENACANDGDVREEVESLLRSYEVAGSFMESPAVAQAADDLADEQKLTPGQRVKHYQIVNLIGEGGMGEVYLATDTILGRRVALKVLPTFVSKDPERLRRFTQEARAASRLSHPNVCVVHEVGETEDGRPFIAMEYIEGQTLRQRIRSQAMKLGDVLDIAIQVADALIAAHEAGIVHRDIKPENIVIRPEGYVKILDFGLAKLTERHKGATHTTMSTLLFNSSPGTVIGTAAYMSPEQARGVAVDERTDIWGLGVVLYELASGRVPFTGETPTDVVVAIVEREQPPISEHVDGAPPELERIVRKALRKDKNERYQIVKELAIDLRSLRKELEKNSMLERSILPGTGSSASSEYARASSSRDRKAETDELKQLRTDFIESLFPRRPGWMFMVVGILVLLGVIFGTYYKRARPSEPKAPVPFERVEVTKLTTNGNALMGALSPDGKYVAYVTRESGKESLWLRQVDINSNAQLLAPREGQYQGVAFSPDGNYIYFGYAGTQDNDAGRIYRLPVLGIGATATQIEFHEGLPALSHDRKRIAFIRFDRQSQFDSLIVANPDGSGEQVLGTRKWPERFGWDPLSRPEWSVNDQTLILPVVTSDRSFTDDTSTNFSVTLFEKDLVGSAERTIPLSPQKFDEIGRVTVHPNGNGVIMLGKAHGAAFVQIWQLFRDGSQRALTNDLSEYRELSLRADGSALITVQTQTLSRLWLLHKNEVKPAPVGSGTSRYYDLSLAPDNKILYASDASGIADIFEIALTGGDERPLTSAGGRNYAPVVSPDNRYVVFHSNRTSVFQVWRTDRDGSRPKQLTTEATESTWPTFSPDGKWVLFQHADPNNPYTLWRVSIEGGTPERVTDGLSIRATVSPDGKLVAFWHNDQQQNSRWRLKVVQLDTGATFNIFDVAQTVQVQWDTSLRWSPDGQYLTYVDHAGGIDNIWGQPFAGGAPKQLTNFDEGRIFSFDWGKDGSLVASRGVITSDVVLIKDAGK